MNKTILVSVIVAFLASGIFSASGQAPARPQGVLAVLRAGQAVNLKESSGRFEIGVFDKGPDVLGHKIVEVGNDYVVLQDIAGVSETRIPLYSVKAVTTWKVFK
jgi:hypothetical protein